MIQGPPLPLEWDCASCAALQAEIERLNAERGYMPELVVALRAEIERLRDALKAIECHSIDHTDACRMAEKARAALEPKP